MAPPYFTDFNLVWKTREAFSDLIDTAIELGYERVAANNVASSLQGGKGKKQGAKVTILPPSELLLNEESRKVLQTRGRPFEQLSRFTAVLHDASNTHRLGTPEVQAYNIIAVQPTDEKTFQLACSTLDVDLICFNFSESLGFSLKRPLIKMAAKRGIHFEIEYSPALRDNNVKRSIISNAMSLVNAGGGKNIILSSGSEQPLDLRSPYDVINLARLFGLNHSQAKDSISRNCRAVLKHAESRKTCKSVISVMKVSTLHPKDEWILQTNRTNAGLKETADTGDSDVDNSDEDEDSDDGDRNGNTSDDETQSHDTLDQPKRKKLKV